MSFAHAIACAAYSADAKLCLAIFMCHSCRTNFDRSAKASGGHCLVRVRIGHRYNLQCFHVLRITQGSTHQGQVADKCLMRA